MRADGRKRDEIRPMEIIPNYLTNPEGSVLVKQGNNKILCCVSIRDGVPPFLRGNKRGWLSAEYSMLPCATVSRNSRESIKGKQQGRSVEIQRMIGRALRSALDLEVIGEKTLIVDCDVLEADGSTRVASITGAYVALSIALKKLEDNGTIPSNPIIHQIAALSVGIVNGESLVDLTFEEDSNASTDANLVMNEEMKVVEIQGTAEGKPYSVEELNSMISSSKKGFEELFEIQKKLNIRS